MPVVLILNPNLVRNKPLRTQFGLGNPEAGTGKSCEQELSADSEKHVQHVSDVLHEKAKVRHEAQV